MKSLFPSTPTQPPNSSKNKLSTNLLSRILMSESRFGVERYDHYTSSNLSTSLSFLFQSFYKYLSFFPNHSSPRTSHPKVASSALFLSKFPLPSRKYSDSKPFISLPSLSSDFTCPPLFNFCGLAHSMFAPSSPIFLSTLPPSSRPSPTIPSYLCTTILFPLQANQFSALHYSPCLIIFCTASLSTKPHFKQHCTQSAVSAPH